MTGPEHYREAERLLELAQHGKSSAVPVQQVTTRILEAIAHALLADAAARALAIDPTPEAVAAWDPFLLAEDDDAPDGAELVEAVIVCERCEHPEHTDPCDVRTTGVLVCGCTA